MKIIMRRDFVIFQNREIGYAKGGTFLMKDFNQKTVLQRLRLHGVVELIRDRAAENAVPHGYGRC